MKVTIMDPGPDGEEEIVIKCSHLDDDMVKLINRFKQGSSQLTVYKEGNIFFIERDEIFYFESVDQKVFVYCHADVYEVKSKLYEVDGGAARTGFYPLLQVFDFEFK